MTTQNMQGKQFLYQLSKLQLQIDEKSDELEYWKRHLGSYHNNSKFIQKICQRSDELSQLIQSMNEQKILATKMIDCLADPVARAIMRRRYILGESWPDIAIACGRMSERNAHYIHDKALLEFEEIYCGHEAAVV